ESLRDLRARALERLPELCAVAIAERAGQTIALRSLDGNDVCLHAGRELHAVLDPTQQRVAVGDGARLAIRHVAARAQLPQRVQRVRRAHRRILSAPDELQRLHEELRLADTARTELEIARRRLAQLD